MSPASANPFAFLFGASAGEAAAPVPAEAACSPRPGKSTAGGLRWVYRFEGHRKCWFQTAERTTVNKPVHHHASKHPVDRPEEGETAQRNRKAVVDARAELLPPVRAEAPQPPAPELKVVDAAPVPPAGAAALVPPPPVLTDSAVDHPTPQEVDVETLLAAAPAASDTVAGSAPPPSPAAVPVAERADGRGSTATWIGGLFMVLGLVSLLGSSRILRAAVRVGRSRSKDRVGGHRERELRGSSFASDPHTFDRRTAEPRLSSMVATRGRAVLSFDPSLRE
jgi:hypothetical protein